MGETSDLMLEGVLCIDCGVLVIEEGQGEGYPKKCSDCDNESND